MTGPLLSVQGLGKAFGGLVALEGVDLELRAGERLALIGPNGAGKTTCFGAIGGQLAPDSGRVLLQGRDVTGQAPHRLARQGLGRTFQVAATFGALTVRQNVQAAILATRRQHGRLWRPADACHREEADRLLARMGLEAEAEQPCGLLAYGELKRVELAIALAGRPVVLLMDEPTAGMALGERRRLMALVDELVREDDIAVFFTEHDMDVVFRHADRIMVLDRGRVIADGAPEAVREDREVRRVYLGSWQDDGASPHPDPAR